MSYFMDLIIFRHVKFAQKSAFAEIRISPLEHEERERELARVVEE
jgi:hypothetical protein